MNDSDDDVPQLSSEALAALQEFYIEQQQKEEIKIKEESSNYCIGSIEENWVSRCSSAEISGGAHAQ